MSAPARPGAPLADAASALLRALDGVGPGGGPGCRALLHPLDDEPSLIGWLDAFPREPRALFADLTGSFALAGVGSAETLRLEGPCSLLDVEHEVEQARRRHPRAVGFLGGVRFAPHRAAAGEWAAFGAAWFLLPRLFVLRDERGPWLGVHVDGSLSARRDAARLLEGAATPAPSLPDDGTPAQAGAGRPGAEGYQRSVERGLEAIATGEVEKVVLARSLPVVGSSARGVGAVLDRLCRREASGFAFWLAPRPGVAFFGVSPEQLYRRVAVDVAVDALAGTAPRGTDDAEDERLASALRANDKERREHELVRDAVLAALSPRAQEIRVGEAGLRRLAHVQHLHTPVHAVLKEAGSLLSLLHPTPAVCGWPTERAEELIASLEPFDRGLYAGPVGFVGPAGERFAVALRCARADDDGLVAYSGAGIVAGSEPSREWAEVERKMRGLLQALGAV